jgi:transposase-like protein
VTTTEIRTLPLRLAPLPGEALDSWLAALAHRSQVCARDILIAAGLPGRIHRASQGAYTTRLTLEEAEQIAAATGVPAGRLHAMTLALYDGKALDLSPQRRAVNTARLWARGPGSRYCPPCLAETAGRWPLRWRLTWSVACTRHGVLLAHHCPGCGRRPHARYSRRAGLAANLCHTRLDSGVSAEGFCGTDLARVGSLIHLGGQAHPVLAAQGWLDGILAGIERGTTADPAPRSTLTDLTVLASWLIRRARPGDFTRYGHGLDQARAAYGTGWLNAPVDAAVLAGPLTRAVEIYRDLGEPDGVAAISTLLDRDAASNRNGRVTKLGNHGQRRSTRLQQTVWQAADSRLDTCDRLRFRTPTTTPRAPVPTDPKIAARAASIPLLLWRDWTILLMPRLGDRGALAAQTALSVALLLPGRSKRALAPLAALLHKRPDVNVSQFLYTISKDAGRDTLAAICTLADWLDEHPAPIDYHRRRALDGEELLPQQTWAEICFRTNTAIGRSARLQAVRRFLYQRMTGADLLRSTGQLAIRPRTGEALRLAAAPFLMTEPLLEALDAHAGKYLEDRGIHEPVTWSPPISLVSSLDLPGQAQLRLDLTTAFQDYQDRQIPPRTAALELGISLDRIRLHFETSPPATPWPHRLMALPARNPKTPAGSRLHGALPQQLADQVLTRDFLLRERLTNRKSIKTIARETGQPPGQVTRRLAEEGLPSRVGKRSAAPVDEAWLVQQYTVEGRSMRDIAAEAGMGPTTLRTRLADAGIAPRSSAGAVTTPARVLQAAPPLLHPALQRPIGLARLRALRLIAEHATVEQAAKAEGVKRSTLHRQLTDLATDLRTKLWTRAQRGRPLALTPAGAAVLRALAILEIRLGSDTERGTIKVTRSTEPDITAVRSVDM